MLVQTTLAARSESALTRYLPPGLWLDSWSQRLETNPERATQGMSGYLQRHGLSGAAKRLVRGMADQVAAVRRRLRDRQGSPEGALGAHADLLGRPLRAGRVGNHTRAGLMDALVHRPVRRRGNSCFTPGFPPSPTPRASPLMSGWCSRGTRLRNCRRYCAGWPNGVGRRGPELREAVPKRVVAGIVALLISAWSSATASACPPTRASSFR